ncbi:hypothetical protein HDV02_000453 [Globomyces sp. JEL0801]|nr:hypothetical protein HDV02_000453 [Globomyces sp. JEL0801]
MILFDCFNGRPEKLQLPSGCAIESYSIQPKNDFFNIKTSAQLYYYVSNYPSSKGGGLAWNLQCLVLSTKEFFQISRRKNANHILINGNLNHYMLQWKYRIGCDYAIYELSVANLVLGQWIAKSFGGYKFVMDGHILAELDEPNEAGTWGTITIHPEGRGKSSLLVICAFMIAYRNLHKSSKLH